MTVEIKDIDQCVKEIMITVPSEEAMKDYRKVLGKFKNYVAVPGFRKGKAPVSMVENLFADQAREAYLKDKAYDYYEQAIAEKNVKPLQEGMPVKVEWEKGKDLLLVFRYEVEPQVVIEKYTGLEIPYKHTEFSEKMTDDTLENLQSKMAEEEIVEGPAGEGDILTVDLNYLNKADTDQEEKKEKISDVILGDNTYGEEFNKALTGRKKGDVIKTVLSVDQSSHPVEATIENIKRKAIPAIDDSLAKEAGMESLEAMRKNIESSLHNDIEKSNLQSKKMSLLATLMKLNPFDIPPSSVMYYSQKLAEPYARLLNKKPEDLAEHYYKNAFFEIKSFFIVRELTKKLDLEIKEEDENEMIKEMAEELSLSVEDYKAKNPDVTKQEDFVNRIKEKKLYDYLFENNTFIQEEKVEEEESHAGEGSAESDREKNKE